MATTSVRTHQNYIGGEWVDAVSGDTFESTSPADGELLVQASSRKVSAFVATMLREVPDGQESAFVDLDTELATLLGA